MKIWLFLFALAGCGEPDVGVADLATATVCYGELPAGAQRFDSCPPGHDTLGNPNAGSCVAPENVLHCCKDPSDPTPGSRQECPSQPPIPGELCCPTDRPSCDYGGQSCRCHADRWECDGSDGG